ncbi:MAG: peptide-methionine (R)-S-oxide reductase MsrB [Candidatus Pacearchaeota archaeon]
MRLYGLLGFLFLIFLISYLPGNQIHIQEVEGNFEEAVFAGGCFWCVESDFEKLPGVMDVVSGYSGGSNKNPTYQNYAQSGHIEVAKVIYDSNKISYEDLLEHFWTHVDPLDGGGQFCDRGNAYTSAIFYSSEEEKDLAENSKLIVGEILNSDIQTNIFELGKFWPAEEYHQGYYEKHPFQYNFYRVGCGRDKRVEEVWSGKTLILNEDIFTKPTDEELKKLLTPNQYHITQEDGTEKPFDNEYWDNKEEGIYVDLISGEALFSSKDKYVSETGWPSFTKPLESGNIVEKTDYKLILPRTEIRSKLSDSHLGHLFKDGPKELGGLRYCMNSAALKFIPKKNLEKEDYGEYLGEFE